MVQITRTTSDQQEFIALVGRLDAELSERDGADHAFYAQFNSIGKIKHVVVAFEGENPVGCGAIKEFEPGTMEVKRMYVLPEKRGAGIAALILSALEQWAAALNCSRCVLETGQRQPEAIRLYTKSGYRRIPNYGQYAGIENSLCFEKKVNLP